MNGTSITIVGTPANLAASKSISLPAPSGSAGKYRCDRRRGADDHAAVRSRCIPALPAPSGRHHHAILLPAVQWACTADAAAHRRRHCGTGQVLGSDLRPFVSRSISGGAVTAYDISGSPVGLQLRWAKVDSSSLGTRPHRHLEHVLPGRLQRHRHRLSPGRTSIPTSPSRRTAK